MKKNYRKLLSIVGTILIIGILIINIISICKEKEFTIELTTIKLESVETIEIPQFAKRFIYKNMSLENFYNLKTIKGKFVKKTKIKDNVEVENESKSNINSIISVDYYSCSLNEIYYTSPLRAYTEEQKELISKMLYCEAGGMGWDCQVATCSAIINFIEHYGGDFSVLDDENKFNPAPYYRYKVPTLTNYQVLDYVLSGHLIANIKYFRLNHYHYDFGIPMFEINNVYFSR